ncbi:septum formation family protein [Herbiconiux sp. CPCC 205716]|uniref:Septum formation family protein n=1 Tax=Herbiconiux gentiana TaxID=2970912 RepID=A0ABT2GHR4_9MICO|nr:septum formation family protein [Herbiconiux gentiana]MCS5715764.1 septum formation family protein [Herbiconiux gentiana]
MAPTSRRTVRLTVVGAVLLAVVVVAALFVVGLRVGQSGAAGETSAQDARSTPFVTPSPSPTPSSSPTPAAPALPPAPTALAAPGEHPYSALFGGECLGAFDSPWAETFSVVDCAAAHPSQLTTRALFPEPAGAPYPGEAALASRMNLLCTAPTAVNAVAAPDVADLRWQASFPATTEAWDAGDRVYQCFFTTASGAPLTGSLAP